MNDTEFKLLKPPIIEAVLDIDCDMPPGFDLAALEGPSREWFRDQYPKFRRQFMQEHKIETKPDAPPQMSVRHEIQSLQFLHDDEKQLVQVRAEGFSFNRLAPYTGLDDYLPEIERTWKMFIKLAAPVQIRTVRLRYINRMLLPVSTNGVELQDYLKIGPRLPDETRFTLVGFLDQQAAVENATGNRVNIVLTGRPEENEQAPIIFDITAECPTKAEIQNWAWLLDQIQSLRALKNHIFKNTLTEKCLSLFQQP